MGGKVDLKNVPTAAWVCITLAFLGVTTAFVVLAVVGADSTEFRGFLNIVANLASILLGGGSVIYAGAAARNAQVTREQTNGLLDTEREEVARAAAAAVVDDLRTRGVIA